MMRDTWHARGLFSHIAWTLGLVALLALAACSSGGGGGGGGDDDAPATRSYNGAGSVIGLTFTPSSSSAGTFYFTTAPDMASATDGTVSGSYTTYSTGFMELTVTASTGTASGATVGAKAAALELPGVVVFAAPFDSEGDGYITVLIPTGSCPSSTMSLGWVKSRVTTWAATDDVFGEFRYVPGSPGEAFVDSKYALNDGSAISLVDGTDTSLGTATCSNGKLQISGVDVFLNAAGGALAHDTGSGEIIAALPLSSSVTGNDIGGDYAGVAFEDGGNNTPFNVAITAGATANGTGTPINIVTGASTGSAGTLSLTAGPFGGSLVGDLNGENLACMGLLNAAGSGKNVITCGSMTSTPNYFSLFMVEK
jgi:hypothetical protein